MASELMPLVLRAALFASLAILGLLARVGETAPVKVSEGDNTFSMAMAFTTQA